MQQLRERNIFVILIIRKTKFCYREMIRVSSRSKREKIKINIYLLDYIRRKRIRNHTCKFRKTYKVD